MFEDTICLQCGDRGFEKAFVFCIRCVEFAVHRYCLDVIPETLDEIVLWLCDDCKVREQKRPVVKHDAIPSKTRHNEVLKNIKGCLENGKKNNGVLVVKANNHVQKDGPEQAYDACTMLDSVECGESAGQHTPLLLDGKNDENGSLLSADASKKSEQSSSSQQLEEENVDGNQMEPIKLANGRRNITESSTEKNKHRLATTSDSKCVKVDIECRGSASEAIELSTGCAEQKKTEIKNKKKRKTKRSVMESTTQTDQHGLPTTSCNERVEVDINKCTRLESELLEFPGGCVEQTKTEIKKKRKRNVVQPTAEEDQHRLPTTSYKEVVEVDINERPRLESDPVELSADCVEQKEIKKKRKEKKRKRNIMEPTTEENQHGLVTTSCDERVKVDINKLMASESIELSAGCLEQNKTEIKKKRKRNAMERDQNRLNTPSCNKLVKVDPIECPSLASDPVELEQKTTKIKKRRKKRMRNIMESTTEDDQHRLATTLPSEVRDDECAEQKDQTCISNRLRSLTDLGIAGAPADQPLVSNKGASNSVEKKKTSIAQVLESKENHLENEFADLRTVERGLGSSNDPIKNRGPENKEEQTCTSCQRRNASEYYPQDLDFTVAEPVAMPIWRGSLNILSKEYDGIYELIAHISSKACHRVYETASQFQPVLHLEMFPKSDIWPKSFRAAQPNSDSIGLYFFPSKISEQAFDQLVEEMIHKELAFKASMQNVELLIFTSTELPLHYWRFGRKYYLWGVFREKQTAPSSDSA